jgi:competence protein ComFC
LPPQCERCGEPLRNPGFCQRCLQRDLSPLIIRSWGYYEGPLRNAIHKLEYHRNLSLSANLAEPLIQYLDDLAWEFDSVIPVPLGVARLRERGYNQAALLALPIALQTGAAYIPRGLVKVRETPTQVGLNREKRWENVINAFRAVPEIVFGRSILVVVDVTTSNATLEACSASLLAAKAKQVYCLTLARAGLHPKGGIP